MYSEGLQVIINIYSMYKRKKHLLKMGRVDMSNFSEKHTDYAFGAVPVDKRQNFYQLTVVWTGFIIATANLLSGSIAGSSLSLGKALLATLVGNLILTFIGICQSRTACETNLSTYVLARYALGIKGAKFMSLVFIVNLIGWFGVGVGLAAKVASSFIPMNEHMIAFLFSLLFMTTAMYGYKGLKILSSFAVPFVIVVSILGVYKVIGQSGGITQLISIVPTETKTFSFVVFLTVGSWVSGAITAPDISRYAKDKKSAYSAVTIGFLVGNTLLMVVGAILGLSAGTWDLALILSELGLGLLGLVFLIVVQWTTSDNTLYSAGLALANLFDLKSKFWVTLIAGAFGTILATVGIYNHIIPFIVLLGSAIMPLAGILIVDYQFFREKYSEPHQNISKQVSIPAVTAWIVGFIVAKFIPWGSPAINSLILSGLIHYVLSKIMGHQVAEVSTDSDQIAG